MSARGLGASGSTPKCWRLKRRSSPCCGESSPSCRTLARSPGLAGVTKRATCVHALRRAVAGLFGASIPASALERDVSRCGCPTPADLDSMLLTSDLVWVGRSGSASVTVRWHCSARWLPASLAWPRVEPGRAAEIHRFLGANGASFFADIYQEWVAAIRQVLDALWDLVWSGHVTNDSLHPLGPSSQQAARRGKPNLSGRFRRMRVVAGRCPAPAGDDTGRRRGPGAARPLRIGFP